MKFRSGEKFGLAKNRISKSGSGKIWGCRFGWFCVGRFEKFWWPSQHPLRAGASCGERYARKVWGVTQYHKIRFEAICEAVGAFLWRRWVVVRVE